MPNSITPGAHQDEVVRVHRSCTDETLDGYIVAVGREWLLLTVVDGSASVDGFAVLRTSDIVSVETQGNTDQLVRQSLQIRREWPPPTLSWSINLDSTAEMLRDVASHASVVGLYIEHEDPDVLFVGVPYWHRDDALGLSEIDSTGRWVADDSEWEFDRISRLALDDRYVNRVLEVARSRTD